MIEPLQRFVHALRDQGIAASPAEAVDAARAIDAIGLDSRESLRDALAAALVKRQTQRPVFERVFEEFFRSPGLSARRGKKGKGAGAGSSVLGAGSRAGDDRGRGGRPTEDAPPEGLGGQPSRPDDPSARPTAAGTREGHRGAEGDREDRRAQRMRALMQRLRRGERPDVHDAGRLRAVVLRSEASRRGQSRVDEPLRRRLTPADEAALAEGLAHWLRRLRARRSRRLRRHRRGQLHLRRLLRAAAGRDGVPWELPRRRPRRRPARPILLLDVSHSTARATALFLSLIGGVLARQRDARVLLFVDRPVDATREVRAWLARPPGPPRPGAERRRPRPAAGIVRGGISFADLLETLPDFDPHAPSDYGRALDALSRHEPGIGRRSVVVILGDGRNNRFDPQAFALEELRDRTAAVLWLVCEPVGRWGTGDSVLDRYAPHVDVLVEANDVEGLARGALEVARRLGT